MNFLSSALSSLTGTAIPYNIGDECVPDPALPRSVWRMFEGTKKDDGTPCTVFQRDRNGSIDDELALNALRKLRATRLPGVLKVLDTFETDSTLHIVTERVTPLIDVIRTVETTDAMLQLIVFCVTKALKFINVEGASALGQLTLNTVYLTPGGDVRLGGFELCTNLKSDPKQPLQTLSSALPAFRLNPPPELNNGTSALKGNMALKLDGWLLGCFIYSLFNDCAIHFTYDDMKTARNVPRNMSAAYQKLIGYSVTTRASPEQFLKNGGNTYLSSPIISIYTDLEELSLRTEDEKMRLFESLESVKDDAPPGFLEYRVLPELVTFFNQAPSQGAFSLRFILSYAENMQKGDGFAKLVKPVLLKAFALPDRQIRMILLGFLPKYIDNLDRSDITDRIFTNYTTGFSDSNPAIREESVKAVLYMAPRLTERQLNNDLLRFLAKTQADEKPEIRCNTTICIGKIAEHLNKNSRPTVLATAFAKGLKDPFIHSRLASLMALSSCLDFFTPEIIANKILTVIAPSLLDKSSKVRDEAQKAFDQFFQKIKLEAAKLPVDTEEGDETVDEVTTNVKNFGISFTNTFSQLTANLGGSLNPQGGITPDDSRAGTPQVIESFKKSPQDTKPALAQPAQVKPKVSYAAWGEEEDELEADDDDAWGFGDSPVVMKTPKVPKPTTVAPKVSRLATESKPKLAKKPSLSTGGAKRSLQLKKSKLKLELEDDGDDDGWGDGW